MSIYSWDIDPKKNNKADELIIWDPGQPPSSVNSSARAMMTRFAEYIKDQSGEVKVGGTNNDIIVELFSKPKAFTPGLRFSFIAAQTNSGEMTIAINSIEDEKARKQSLYYSSTEGFVKVASAMCKKGCLYDVIYAKIDAQSERLVLLNPTIEVDTRPYEVPTGGIISHAGLALDSEEWLLCDGKEYSKHKYSRLYEVIKDVWGQAKDRNSFVVPDFRGTFLRGLDNGRGLDASRTLGSYQDSANKKHSHQVQCQPAGKHTHKTLIVDFDHGNLHGFGINKIMNDKTAYFQFDPPSVEFGGDHKHDIIITESGENEARPVNYAVQYYIKT